MNVERSGDMTVFLFNLRSKPFRRIAFPVIVSTFLSACAGTDGNATDDDEIVVSNGETAINLALPQSILSRKIEPDEYSLTLVVNGNDVSMVRNGTSWEGETFVAFGAELDVSLSWSAQGVPLANLTRNYGTAEASNPINISSADYSYIDSDNDQLSNFAELNAEPASDPYDANSPGDVVVVTQDTSAIAGVYQDTLESGDLFAIFITDSATYQILDFAGDAVDLGDFCWVLDPTVYTVQNQGGGIYEFEASFPLTGGMYFVSRNSDATVLTLESSQDTLEWEIVQTSYEDPSTVLEPELYCPP